jgi:putative effector of murein hydrolase
MTPHRLTEIWVYLAASPLLHLTLTVAAYLLADFVYRKSGRRSLLNPVLVAVLILVGLLTASDTSYPTYFEGAQFVHFLLGPATVALAVPLYFNFWKLKRLWVPITAGLLAGAATAALTAVGCWTPRRRPRWRWPRSRSQRPWPWESRRSWAVRPR